MSAEVEPKVWRMRFDVLCYVLVVIISLPCSFLFGGYVSGRSGGSFSTMVEVSLSVVGLVISICGFTIAISEIIKARQRAEMISETVSNIKRQFSSFDVITELRTCRSSVEETVGHLGSDHWVRSISSYNVSRVSLIKITSIRNGIEDVDRERLKDFTAEVLLGCETVEKLHGANSSDIPKADLVSSLRNLEACLIEIEFAKKDGLNV